MTDIKLQDLDQLEPVDIEEYLEYLKYYTYDGEVFTNDERGIKRKFASLRSFYSYYQKRKQLKNNPTVVVDMPKLHNREIVRLDEDEVSELLQLVEHGGDDLSGMKKVYYDKNKRRNIAIFTLFLGTGIRVSECVGLDVEDVDFKNSRIRIIRKGGKEEYIYFGDEVKQALADYIENDRNQIVAKEGHEHALFYSIQKRRISVQAVENLVSDFTSQLTTFKHITPHKLRSTYGTSLYRETGDIYLVAEVLGHNDVNTTRKHYAAMEDDKKRSAANAVTLHKKS
jgi:site-specific recombinase XerD